MLILRQGTRAELTVRKSRFLAEATPVDSVESARALWRERKRIYADSNHVVFAFVCGPQGGVMGCSDDGEPSGTSGRPTLEVLKGSGITNVLLTVTRWFGGIKLGTGGLVRAYTESAQLALADAQTAELVPMTRFTLALSYLHYESVRRRLAEFAAEITGEEFAAGVTLAGTIPSANYAAFAEAVRDLTSGSSAPRIVSSDS
ncbi:MAG: IMPACT family protein [Lentisphaeria bacterium]|nr:IMPACT family protein [Lentisphaeria bacterium]